MNSSTTQTPVQPPLNGEYRVLLIRVSSMGDIVHALPALTDLQAAMPNAKIDWLCEEGFVDLPALHPACAHVVPYALRRWRKNLLSSQTRHEMRELKQRLRTAQYDLVIDLSEQVKTAWVASWTGSRCVVGFDRDSVRERPAGLFYHYAVHAPRAISSVARYRTMVLGAVECFKQHLNGSTQNPRLLNPPTPNGPARFGLRATPLKGDWLPHKYIVLNTCASRDNKLWPVDDWHALAKNLGMPVVLPWGSSNEQIAVASLAQPLPYAVVSPALSLREAAQLFAGARWVIGLDTGLTHLAAALGKPTVGIFCASNSQLTPVVGEANLVKNVGTDGHPPDVSAVLDALEEVLQHAI